MKICIPVLEDCGLAARTYDHFGRAPFYALVDTTTGEIRTVRNHVRRHAHGECDAAEHMPSDDIDAVVCSGIGRRALASLERTGLQVLRSPGRTVEDALAAARGGRLSRLTADDACAEHGHGHGPGHPAS